MKFFRLLAGCAILGLGICEGKKGRFRRFGKAIRGIRRDANVTDVDGNTKEFEVRPSDKAIRTKSKLGFHIRPFPSFRTLIFNDTGDTREAFGYRVNVLRLAEVGPDTDALNSTNTIDLKAQGNTWSFASTVDRTVNDTVIKTMQATFTSGRQGDPKASVILSAELAMAEVEDRGHRFKPNALKWSMNISDFPYSEAGDTKLAILVSVNANQQHNVTTGDDGSVTVVQVGSGNGTFTWTPTVLADEVSTPLKVTELGLRSDLEDASDTYKLNNEQALYLQFTVDGTNKPNKIYWDPENDVDEDKVLGNEELEEEDNGGSALAKPLGFLAAFLGFLWLL